MSIKLVILKSGEDVIADVKELISDNENVVGYLLQKPHRIISESIPTFSESEEGPRSGNVKITLTPWIPLTSDEQIPVRPDWIVTIAEPIKDIVTMYDNYGFETEVLVASIRSKQHVIDSAIIGADVATLPPKVIYELYDHPLTEKGLKAFLDDWAKTGQSILPE